MSHPHPSLGKKAPRFHSFLSLSMALVGGTPTLLDPCQIPRLAVLPVWPWSGSGNGRAVCSHYFVLTVKVRFTPWMETSAVAVWPAAGLAFMRKNRASPRMTSVGADDQSDE